ncbi:MAG: hypothetical protein KUG82_03280 [Pseudomonadales bacterium]|nr:hypothetical protein [Pseudomonadales bacterium]
MKLLILVILLSNLSGCAWIALDRYYGVDGINDQWQSEFRPGKTSTKMMGYPDTQIHSFAHSEFKLTVDISYQDTGAFGPLIVPIIPTPWDSDQNIMVRATVYTESEIEIDFSLWKITTNGVIHNPEKVFVIGVDETGLGKVKLAKNSTIFIVYELKAVDVDSLLLDFGPVEKGPVSIKIPELNLLKTKGTWHYEVWTV